MLGHEDVSGYLQIVTLTGLFEDGEEGVFGFGGGDEGEAVVAAEGEEVEVAGGLTTFQAWGMVG